MRIMLMLRTWQEGAMRKSVSVVRVVRELHVPHPRVHLRPYDHGGLSVATGASAICTVQPRMTLRAHRIQPACMQ